QGKCLRLFDKHEGGLVFEGGNAFGELKDRLRRVVQFSEVFTHQSRHNSGGLRCNSVPIWSWISGRRAREERERKRAVWMGMESVWPSRPDGVWQIADGLRDLAVLISISYAKSGPKPEASA